MVEAGGAMGARRMAGPRLGGEAMFLGAGMGLAMWGAGLGPIGTGRAV
jgi:hypothetical protein